MTALLVAISVFSVACGSSSESETGQETTIPPNTTVPDATTSTEATTTTTVPTTTTTVDPIPAAADYYLTIVAPSNCAFARIVEAEDAILDEEGFIYEEDWPELSNSVLPLYADWAQSLVVFIEDLVAYDWPSRVEADMDRLVEELSEAASWSQGYSQLPSFDALVEYPPYPDDVGAATAIRAKLGLPTNVGADPGGACSEEQ